MVAGRSGETRIVVGDNRVITRGDLFEKKGQFRKEQARLPFEEKIRILVRWQEIARSAQASLRPGASQTRTVWRL